jgi:hypothetical protein
VLCVYSGTNDNLYLRQVRAERAFDATATHCGWAICALTSTLRVGAIPSGSQPCDPSAEGVMGAGSPEDMGFSKAWLSGRITIVRSMSPGNATVCPMYSSKESAALIAASPSNPPLRPDSGSSPSCSAGSCE